MNCGFFTVKRNTASEINKEMLNDIFAEFDESSRVRTNSTDREMEAVAETSSWSLLLKDKSVCSKHIQKVSTRLGKKVFFKVDVSSTSSLSRFNMFTVNMLNLDKLEVDDTSAKFTTEITKKYISTK